MLNLCLLFQHIRKNNYHSFELIDKPKNEKNTRTIREFFINQ